MMLLLFAVVGTTADVDISFFSVVVEIIDSNNYESFVQHAL